MIRTYQFRCRPTKAQSTWVDNALDLTRALYNAALQERRDCYEKTGKGRSFYDQDKCLKTIRADNPEYGALPHQPCREALRDLDRAFQAFFRRVKSGDKPGFPRFKSYRRPRQSLKFGERINWHKCKGKLGYVVIKGMPGKLRFKIHNPAFLREGVVRKTTTLTRDHKGLLVSFACEVPAPLPLPTEGMVGIDVGLSKFLTTDDGDSVDNPRPLAAALRDLRREQRALARKKKGSANRERNRMRVARLHARVANFRKTFHCATAARIVAAAVAANKSIAIEDLNIKGLARGMLARHVVDVAWGYFINRLVNKAESAGVPVNKVDPKFTSQACSGCGALVRKPLRERRHSCPHCGLSLDRDHNAAINIARAVTSPLDVNGFVGSRCPQDQQKQAVAACG